jgi:hypothetical protein
VEAQATGESLRGALQRDDAQMPTLTEIADVEVEPDSRTAPYQRPR